MELAEMIRVRRIEMGLSQEQLASKAGTSQQNVERIENGTVKHSRYMNAILRELGLESGTAPKGEASRPIPQFLGESDLPVYSAVEGGPGEMVVSTEPIDFVPRPWFLKNVKDGYAVVVTGESMIPVYEPGDLVIVNPRLQAIRGKNAIFVSGSHELGDFKATVKRLLRSAPDAWHVKQYNPPDGMTEEFALPKRQWPLALRIVGRYEGG